MSELLPFDLDAGRWLGAALIVYAGCMVQAAIGFAYALIATPLLLSLGFDLPESVALTVTTSTAQRLLLAYQLRRHVVWRGLRTIMSATLLGVPLGVVALKRVSSSEQELVQLFVGLLVLGTVAAQSLFRVRPRERVPGLAALLAGLCSGFLSGLANVGGPPLVFWTYAHAWPRDRLRSTPISISLPIIPLQWGLLLATFGSSVARAIALGLVLVPLSLPGNATGNYLAGKMDTRLLRRLVLLALALLGASYVVRGLV